MKTLLLSVLALVLLFFSIVAAVGALYEPDLAMPEGYVGKQVRVNDVPIRYYQVGRGPDILFLHGAMGSVEDWSRLFPLLRGQFRLTAVDRPGFGFSGSTHAQASLVSNAQVAFDIIEQLKLTNVTVVGHSYGGAVALTMAAAAHDNINGYFLIAPAAYPYEPWAPRGVLKLLTYRYIGEGAAVLLGPLIGDAMIEDALTGMMNEPAINYPPDFISFRQKLWNKAISTTTKARQSQTFNKEIAVISKTYPQIRDSVHLIIGDADSEEIKRQSDRLIDDIPGTQYKKLPGVNHYVQFEAPQQVAEFLASLVTGH